MTDSGGTEHYGYCFGAFRLYPAQRLLLHEDQEVKIGQRPLSILQYLVANAGRIVSLDEILAKACGGISVDISTLWAHITSVRNAIGSDALVTINSQGYQFVLPIQRLYTPAPIATPAATSATTLPRPQVVEHDTGREAELAELADLIDRHRLVTITGPGGIGKTWLAVELGWRLSERFPQGVHLIDLAPIKQAVSVASTMGRVLRVALRGGVTPIDAITAWIGERPMVVILDNCEHLSTAAADLIEALLGRTPKLRIIVTSQKSLDVVEEKLYLLRSLTPDAAVTLFARRAGAVDPHFVRNDGNEAAIEEICQSLDCLPLALEMAASLVPVLRIQGVRDGLDQRFKMLRTGARQAKDSHRTLLKMVEWSHGLLAPGDQAIFRRLSIFSGSFSLEAATDVAAGPDGDRWTMTEALSHMVETSLIGSEPCEAPRYRLLETLRLYGTEQLKANGEFEAIAERHAHCYKALLEQADAAWETTPDPEWLTQYGPDIDNVRVALDWALADKARTPVAMALAGTSDRLWMKVAQHAEGRRYVDRVVALIDEATPDADAARVLKSASTLGRGANRLRTVAMLERSAALYRQLDDRNRLGVVLEQMGGHCTYLGRHAEAKATLSEAEKLLSAGGQTKSFWNVVNELGSLALVTNDTNTARQHYVAGRDFARSWKDTVRENIAIFNLGEVEFRRGEINHAIEFARESVRGLRSTNLRSYLPWPLVNLTTYLILRGDYIEARSHAAESLSLLREEGGYWLRLCLQNWAFLAALDRKCAEAAQLIGFVTAAYTQSGEIRQSLEQQIYERLSTLLAASLPAADVEFWAVEGARWNEEHAVNYALSRVVSTDDRRSH